MSLKKTIQWTNLRTKRREPKEDVHYAQRSRRHLQYHLFFPSQGEHQVDRDAYMPVGKKEEKYKRREGSWCYRRVYRSVSIKHACAMSTVLSPRLVNDLKLEDAASTRLGSALINSGRSQSPPNLNRSPDTYSR